LAAEYLTIQQFADRLRVSRSTAYGWIAMGKLIAGEHVLHIGGVIRITWGNDLMSHLLELSRNEREPAERPPLKRTGKGGRNRVSVDIEYLESLSPNMV
jgi:hypothetical protein